MLFKKINKCNATIFEKFKNNKKNESKSASPKFRNITVTKHLNVRRPIYQTQVSKYSAANEGLQHLQGLVTDTSHLQYYCDL